MFFISFELNIDLNTDLPINLHSNIHAIKNQCPQTLANTEKLMSSR